MNLKSKQKKEIKYNEWKEKRKKEGKKERTQFEK